MTEERITTINTPDGQMHTHTTVVHDREKGGSTWLLIIVVAFVAALAIWAFSAFESAEVAKDNAVADAANEVGQAADQIGDAAKEAGEAIP